MLAWKWLWGWGAKIRTVFLFLCKCVFKLSLSLAFVVLIRGSVFLFLFVFSSAFFCRIFVELIHDFVLLSVRRSSWRSEQRVRLSRSLEKFPWWERKANCYLRDVIVSRWKKKPAPMSEISSTSKLIALWETFDTIESCELHLGTIRTY
jgi:hypothetical protein